MYKNIILLMIKFLINFAFSDTTRVSGIIDTNTVWTSTGSPYVVVDDVIVNNGVRLEILPGVKVLFTENKSLIIKGKLVAIGQEEDSIIFTTLNTTYRWQRIWIKPEANPCSLKYCRISYACSSAIYNQDTFYIGFSTITNNTAHFGGGIFNNGVAKLTNNTITFNQTNNWGYGGGICNYNGEAEITNNIIINNITDWAGGGIYNNGTVIIINNTITNNSAYYGGGICTNEGRAEITDNTISDNTIYRWGGGIFNGGTARIINNIITNNNAYLYSFGGGIYNRGSAEIRNNIISDNNAYYYGDGGGICNWEGEAEITNNTITNNSAEGFGGGIFNYNGTLTIINNRIINNRANNGGGVGNFGIARITYNTITDSTLSTIWIGASSISLNYNNLNNLNPNGYIVYNDTPDTINGRYNYWHTLDTNIIKQKIYDFYDNNTKGIVHYQPFLNEPGIEEKAIKIPREKFKNLFVRNLWVEKKNLYDITGKLVNGKKLKKGIYFKITKKNKEKILILK